MSKRCKVDGCTKPVKAHGYCNTHYEQIRKHGKLLEPKVLNKEKICSVEGCSSPVFNKGYCSRHYQQIWKYGEIKTNKNYIFKDKEWLNQKYNIELLEEEDIAKSCNVSKQVINKYLNLYKISLQYVEPELHSRLLYRIKRIYNISNMKEYLIEKYIEQNLSAIKIADELNLNRQCILTWMELFNIKRRGNTEAIQKRNAQNLFPTYKQWQLILGSWLGDGNIHKTRNSIHSYYRVTHSELQLEYLLYKKKILEENNLLFFNLYEDKNKTGFKTNNRKFVIESQSTPLFNEIKEKCYTNGKANFNKEFLYQIDDYGLYIWYLDDGSLLHNNYIVLCTDNFTYESQQCMVNFFNTKYNINPVISPIRKLYRLRFNKEDSIKLIQIIEKYKNEVPCMQYKFNINKKIKRR